MGVLKIFAFTVFFVVTMLIGCLLYSTLVLSVTHSVTDAEAIDANF